MTQTPPKSKIKVYPVLPCACGCGKTFEKKRFNQLFYGNHRNKQFHKLHPRQKIGVLTTITIGNTTYDLKNPRPAIMIGRKEDVK